MDGKPDRSIFNPWTIYRTQKCNYIAASEQELQSQRSYTRRFNSGCRPCAVVIAKPSSSACPDLLHISSQVALVSGRYGRNLPRAGMSKRPNQSKLTDFCKEKKYMTMSFEDVPQRLTFNELRHVRNVESQLLTSITILESTTATIDSLTTVFARTDSRSGHSSAGPGLTVTSFEEDLQKLKELSSSAQCFKRSAAEILKRNDKLIHSVCKKTTASQAQC